MILHIFSVKKYYYARNENESLMETLMKAFASFRHVLRTGKYRLKSWLSLHVFGLD